MCKKKNKNIQHTEISVEMMMYTSKVSTTYLALNEYQIPLCPLTLPRYLTKINQLKQKRNKTKTTEFQVNKRIIPSGIWLKIKIKIKIWDNYTFNSQILYK